MRLSTHFSLSEFTKSQTALRRGISNTPGEREIQNLISLCENVLEPARRHFGRPMNVNSGFRSVELNAAIGGSRTSQHCKGEAADVEIAGISNGELAAFFFDVTPYDQLILEFHDPKTPSSGWVHISYRGSAGRQQSLITLDGRAYAPWEPAAVTRSPG
jgi:zinc D-Ala-D-Ala carboxypeptidase